ncbi:MAG TPA: hypothetical protein VNA19_09975 [Pyrinomonadaceae bacterium]|nr:hypothetical protein [Pyrinomonadaceae bacterium]
MTKINHKLAQRAISFLVLIAIMAASIIPASAQRRRSPRLRRNTRVVRTVPVTPRYTVARDTIIRVRMNEQLSSRTARIGDRFSANVTEPVYAGSGVEVVPVGSRVWGRVTSVNRAQRRKAGSIAVAFNSIELPNGVRHAINGSLTTLQTDGANADNEGTVSGRGNDKRNAIFIGGGAAGGALIGAIAGGGKGAAIGAIIGGALGTGARVYEKEQEAEVKSGTEFGVILNQSITMTASNVR